MHAEARARLELGCVVASCGGENGRGASTTQLGCGEAFDEAQEAATTRTDLAAAASGFGIGKHDRAGGIDASDEPAAHGNKAPRFEFVKKP